MQIKGKFEWKWTANVHIARVSAHVWWVWAERQSETAKREIVTWKRDDDSCSQLSLSLVSCEQRAKFPNSFFILKETFQRFSLAFFVFEQLLQIIFNFSQPQQLTLHCFSSKISFLKGAIHFKRLSTHRFCSFEHRTMTLPRLTINLDEIFMFHGKREQLFVELTCTQASKWAFTGAFV